MKPVYFRQPYPSVMVVSHERSGTHFLMNSLANCYGYQSNPRIDLDWHDMNINYACPHNIYVALRQLVGYLPLRAALRQLISGQLTIRQHPSDKARQSVAKRLPQRLHPLMARVGTLLYQRCVQPPWPLRTIVKSHHPPDFFGEYLPQLTQQYVIFYIYRHPLPTMLSLWQLLNGQPSVCCRGPRTTDPLVFLGEPPCGAMLRYQRCQYPTVLHRWEAHVTDWLAAAAQHPRVIPVRYEALDQHFEETVASFAPILGRAPSAYRRPSRTENVIGGEHRLPILMDKAILQQKCYATVGDTMQRLGYTE